MRHASIALLLIILATPAHAQTGKHIALGAGIGFSEYADKDFSNKNPSVSLAYRLRLNAEPTDGWKWTFKSGLGWSMRKTRGRIADIPTQLGKLQTILIMGGGQRVYRQGPWQVGFGIVAGPSFNHFHVDGAARDAYQSRLGLELTDIKVKNSLAVRPDISAWYDLGKWFAVQGSLSYTINRPKAETTLGGVKSTSTWKTDHASASLGLVVGIY
jgi:hypothetical protein